MDLARKRRPDAALNGNGGLAGSKRFKQGLFLSLSLSFFRVSISFCISVFLWVIFLYCEGIGSSYVLSKREHWCLAFVERILLLGSVRECKSRKLDFWVCVFEKDVIRVRNFSIFRVYVGVGWTAAIQALKKQCHTGVS